MTLVAGIAIYWVIWWTVLFVVLPFGVTTQHDVNEVTPGTAASAPLAPKLWRKALATTLIAALLWLGTAYIIVYSPFSLDDIPFMPKFHDN